MAAFSSQLEAQNKGNTSLYYQENAVNTSGSGSSTDDAAPKRLKDITTLNPGKEENGTDAERRHIEVIELDCSDDETEVEEGREGPEAEEDLMQDNNQGGR